MRHEQDGPATRAQTLHGLKALPLKGGIPYGEYLVHDQDIRIQVCRNRKAQAQSHSAGKALDGSVDETLHAGIGHDFIEARLDLSVLHAQYRSVEKYISPACELFVESGAHFEQRRNASRYPHGTRRGVRHSR